jgi:hypothetical protein
MGGISKTSINGDDGEFNSSKVRGDESRLLSPHVLFCWTQNLVAGRTLLA